MTDFFNEKTKNSKVCEVRSVPKKAAATFEELEGKSWAVHSLSRGKEAKVVFENLKTKRELLVYFFKGGCWEWYENEQATTENPDYTRDHRLSLHFEDGSIMSLQDQFHQSHWKWRDPRFQWGAYRSPDIVLEHNAFRRYMYDMRHHPYLSKPVYKVMLHPRFFNGLNNFTRCEILARTRFSPFTTMQEILSLEILREDLFDVSKGVLEDVYRLGGMQFGLWKNPFGVDKSDLNQWVHVYKKKYDRNFFTVKDDEKILYVHKRWRNEFILQGFKLTEEEEE
jgi:formamidopyrimidine-DNA glycosylase